MPLKFSTVLPISLLILFHWPLWMHKSMPINSKIYSIPLAEYDPWSHEHLHWMGKKSVALLSSVMYCCVAVPLNIDKANYP